MVKISVIVPVYNSGQFLEKVLQALRNQDYPRDRYELIFVDNGSSDNSVEILEKQSDIQLLSERERGSYAARNAGIALACGEILAFTDSDCFPEPGWLSVIDSAFEDEGTKLILGRRIPAGDNPWIGMSAEYENLKAEMICQSEDPSVYFGYTNNMAVRKEVMDQLGPFILRPRGSRPARGTDRRKGVLQEDENLWSQSYSKPAYRCHADSHFGRAMEHIPPVGARSKSTTGPEPVPDPVVRRPVLVLG
jgi:glycosyltransferase involved in cell wall biosynthesis